MNKTLPYLVATIVEILDNDQLGIAEEETDEATGSTTSLAGSKSAVIKTTTRQTVFLPVIGLVDAEVGPCTRHLFVLLAMRERVAHCGSCLLYTSPSPRDRG